MELNLKIQPLSSVENLFLQKCLLPKSKFPPELRPGSFCKCLSGESFYLCQAFPRDNLTTSCCYLDETVMCATKAATDVLHRFEVCEVTHTLPVKEIALTFLVTEKLFENKIEKISLEYLIHIAKHYLQALYLMIGTRVQLADLGKLGIAAICIDNGPALEESTMFTIDDETELNVNDVRLLNVTAATTNFYEYGFEQAQQDLEDLLQVAKIQRNSNWRLHPSLNALLVGATGCGKSALVQWFIQKNHCNCFRLTASNILCEYPGETEATLRRKFLAVKTFIKQLKPRLSTILLIEDLHLLCPMSKATSSGTGHSMRICAQLIKLVDDMHASDIGIICLATTSVPETLNELTRRPGRFDREISIPALSELQRMHIFRALFNDSFYAHDVKDKLTNELIDMLVKQTQGYVVADIALLIRNIGQCILREERSTQFATTLKEVLKKSKPTSLHGVDVTVFKTYQRFDSIGGMQKLKRTLEVSVLAGLQQQKAFQRFGLNLPKGLLLYGPPGCAKTTIAKCLATEANMTFIATSGAEVYSPYVGCAEKFLAKIFDTARKHAPCLIFLDEIDSLVGCRSSDSKGDIQIRILSTLLTEMDGIVSNTTASGLNHVLVVAATNRPDMIDDALMRPGRFDKLIHVPAPDLESRLAILKLYAERMAFATSVELDAVAARTENFSGADICNLCNEAALHALTCNFAVDCIEMKDFEYVLCHQKSSLSQAQIQWYMDFEKRFVR